MIKIIINHLLSFKNKLFISIYLLILLTIFIIPLPFNTNIYEINLDIYYYKVNYNEVVIELLKLITTIGILIISIDHNQGYINNISTYKGRRIIIINKLFIYLYLIVINTLIIILMYYLSLNIFNFKMLISSDFLYQTLFLMFDNIIIILFILLFVRSNNKIIGYIIIAIYYILNMFYINIENIMIFYLIPFYSYNYINYSHTIKYVVVYIVMLVSLNYHIYITEDFVDK